MRFEMQPLWRACLIIAVVSTIGCDTGPPQAKLVPVSGTVNLDGAPLAEGKITFAEPSKGAADIISITNGKFEGQTQPGDKKVEIRAYRPGTPNTAMYGPDAKAEMENYIPAKYNTNSNLKANVTEEGTKDLKFDVTSK